MRKDLSEPYDDVYYLTADGDSIPLSAPWLKTMWELIGRQGFEAPDLKIQKTTYANGSQKIISVQPKERTVKLKMACVGESKRERDEVFQDLVRRLCLTGTGMEPGKLILRRYNGARVYLSCVYSAGLNIVEQYRRFHLFDLQFVAADPYFYDFDPVDAGFAEPSGNQSLYLAEDLYLSDDTYLLGSDWLQSIITNDGTDFYPVIRITGPAFNIAFTNQTTGKVLAMEDDFTIRAGETLTIDTSESTRAVILSSGQKETDVTHRIALGSTLDWPIIHGENLITVPYTSAMISAEGYGLAIQTVRRFLSV